MSAARTSGGFAALLALEVAVTALSAYQHHSEAKWEISAAWFGTLTGYLLGRLIYWLPLAIAGICAWLACLRVWPKPSFIGASFLLEVATTTGSVVFRESQPPYGIFFGSFARYMLSRLAVWGLVAGVIGWQMVRRSGSRT